MIDCDKLREKKHLRKVNIKKGVKQRNVERINQIREAMGIQDFRCMLFFVHAVEVAGNIIPDIVVGYFVVT